MSASKTPTTWTSASDVVRHILTVHHSYVRAELPKLADLARQSGSDTVQRLVAAISADMTSHMAKEEQILFPGIVEMEAAAMENRSPRGVMCGAEGPVEQMKAEHADARDVVSRLLQACDTPAMRPLRERVVAFQTDLDAHAGLEETVLFPWALRLSGEA
jgi:regulator of cell morphogenesis and NO signaling